MLNDLYGKFKSTLKRLLPAFLINFSKSILNATKRKQFIRKFKCTISTIHCEEGRAIVMMATPVHGNLGDHAIVCAEKRLLTDLGFGKRIVEVAGSDYALCKEDIKGYISSQDLILIDGGGNLGTLWPWEDDKISEIISSYRENPIIIFPQTCFYDKNVSAQERLKRNRDIYAGAKKLLISLRDQKSYAFCCTHFDARQYVLVPDIVLYLYGKIDLATHTERDGILLCFRKDSERVVSQDEVEDLKAYLQQQNLIYKKTSTIRNYGVNRFSRQTELNKLWSEFASVRLVITDRLHGMIFAAITDTPCLALDNVSRKVSGVYELILGLDYIKICANVDEVIVNVIDYYHRKRQPERSFYLADKYTHLQKFIKEHITD